MYKIDTHVHTTVTHIDPPPTKWNPNPYISSAEELEPHLASQGIRHAIIMSSGEPLSDSSSSSSIPGGSAFNADVMRISQKNPFYSWMCNVAPQDPETLPDRLAEYKSQGAVGVGELMINQWLDSPFLNALFTAAEQLKLPVVIHMSPEPGFSYGVCDRPGLPLLEKLLQDHPDLILVGHSQVFWIEISGDAPSEPALRNHWGKGPVIPGGRVEELMDKYPNLYGDLSAFSGSCAITRDEQYGLHFLEKFQDRLFYATDSTNDQALFPLGKWLDDHVKEGTLSQEAYEKICHGNAERVFSLSIN